MIAAADIAAFSGRHGPAIVAELAAVRGSTPREAGAFMLIAAAGEVAGTIGGGALEYMVIDRARQVLRDGLTGDRLDIPLGPAIGQCCGGRVEVTLRRLDEELAARLVARLEAAEAARPHVYLFGAGHVGHALARALAPLPVRAHVVDTRKDALAGLPPTVEAIAAAMPEAVVRAAPRGASYVILTHDHALDFMIGLEALKRADSPYVGMVGSRTKRTKFGAWFCGEGGDPAALRRLVLPIGGSAFPHGTGDKRPEVIAALAAAEIMVHIGCGEARVTEFAGAGSGAADGR